MYPVKNKINPINTNNDPVALKADNRVGGKYYNLNDLTLDRREGC